ncbi:MAG TPA: DUF4382 domain-containing protein [Gemmatimonadaceae bacterium]|nr:DUF4382 domain-containing protein [Gemmatimonadaceae bacterium]
MHISRFALTLAAASAAVLAACDGATSSNRGGPASLTVLLTDAPFSTADVKSATIFIERIACREETASDEETEDTESTGWTTIVEPNEAINLIVLNNGVTLNLGTQQLPAGTFNSCRIVIDPAQSFVELNDGTKPDIKWPSAGQSGIKVHLDEPVLVKEGSIIVVDFDVGSSFVLRGNSIHNNGLLFKPVVHGVARDVAATFSGKVVGDSAKGAPIDKATVQLLKAGTAVDDTVSANVLRTATTDANGDFTFNFVVPGVYAVRAIPPSGSLYKAGLLTNGVTLLDAETESGALIVLLK